jgi:ATP adenylyltransferase
MNKLWAPWRVKYVTKMINKTKACVFCRLGKSKDDKKNLVFARGKYCFAVLNLFPYNNGHAMILPYRHVAELKLLRKEERQEFFDLLSDVQGLLDEALCPDGYNVGMNLGRVAGAGFPGHLHIHIVPRWHGDVNFMPVVANTKVISQSLGDVYCRLKCAQKKSCRHQPKR